MHFLSTLYCKVFLFYLLLRHKKVVYKPASPPFRRYNKAATRLNELENMNIDNAKSQMRKGMLEYCILLLLKERACYSSDIIQQLRMAELLVVEGTLYPLLTRLKNDGLLSYTWQESTQGPPRKYYSLTDSGQCFLEELDKAWTEIAHTVEILKSNQTQNENPS